jgi:hypothetical protein
MPPITYCAQLGLRPPTRNCTCEMTIAAAANKGTA